MKIIAQSRKHSLMESLLNVARSYLLRRLKSAFKNQSEVNVSKIQITISAALANHRDPNPTFRGVNYDGLCLRYTKDVLPEAVVCQ